jgi:hypothetical protein
MSSASTRTARRSFTTVKEPDPVHSAIELDDIHSPITAPEKRFPAGSSRRLGHGHADSDEDREQHDQNETLPSPTVASHEALERWNVPKANMWRTFAAFWGFAIMGKTSMVIRWLFDCYAYHLHMRNLLIKSCLQA